MRNKNRIATLQSNPNSSNSLLVMLMGTFIIVTIMVSNFKPLFAQHHGAPPPMATLGDRTITMDLVIEPNKII
jgi:hypothetical protein